MHKDPETRKAYWRAYARRRSAGFVPGLVCELEGCDKLVNEPCRRICQMHRRRLRRTGTYELDPIGCVCEECGAAFLAQSPRSFCTTQCRRLSRLPKRSCRYCGHALTQGERTQLCSDACRATVNAENQREWSRANRPASERTTKPCRHCGAAFVGYDNALFCAPKCANRAAKSRRKARQHGAYVEDVWRAKVYQRDGYVCQLCHKPIRRDAVVPHPKAGTLDHILPLAVGGTHEYANVQTAHFMCNSVKGAGDAQLVLALDAYGEHHA